MLLHMVQTFADSGTADIFNGKNTSAARRTCPMTLWSLARRKLDLLDAAAALEDLRMPPGNRLEVLKGDRAGQHSIRINEQYRICFVWVDAHADAVEIVDYH